jgi:hypothetical protein
MKRCYIYFILISFLLYYLKKENIKKDYIILILYILYDYKNILIITISLTKFYELNYLLIVYYYIKNKAQIYN